MITKNIIKAKLLEWSYIFNLTNRKIPKDFEYQVIRWHWNHGMTAMRPRQIEAECSVDGYKFYIHITDPMFYHEWEKRYKDKQV
jgi:hypothetical protein